MLNTRKLLYILPEVSFVAELLPGKKPHSFSIQAFRQINGEFFDGENNFIAENVVKLLSKLDEDEYHLILPDDLFTNTMVTIQETDQDKVRSHIEQTLLPQLGISKDTHQVVLSQLTTFKGESRVQLSAIEELVLEPIRNGVGAKSKKITAISPLTWTIKSVVSLEPSVTVLQLGSSLFSALHYIGVDQTYQTTVDDVEAIAETIKTLKGSEPNIQTVYLITNLVVEERLKELLSDTIPLQQLNSLKEDDAKIPSYVKYCIESGQKTLSISDYPVPQFTLGKKTTTKTTTAKTTSVEALEAPTPKTALPSPELVAQLEDHVVTEKEPLPMPKTDTTVKPDVVVTDESLESTDATVSEPIVLPESESAEPTTEVETKPEPVAEPIALQSTETPEQPQASGESQSTATNDVDLTQFVVQSTDDVGQSNPESNAASSSTTQSKPRKKSMLKMVAIFLLVFITTVAIGVGIGFGVLTLSKSGEPVAPTPEVSETVSPTPTVEPTPEASPSAQLDPADLSILVVNATTKAGYAGTVKTQLDEAGFGSVLSGNAKGTYEDAEDNLVLMSEDNPSLLTLLEKATSLGLAYSEGYKTEDAKGTYDAVVVLTK